MTAIVILGGYISFPMLYAGMCNALAHVSGWPVSIVPAYSSDWLPGTRPADWVRVLDKVDRAVRRTARDSATGKVTLVGHSAGGVLARLYLCPDPLLGHAFCGLQWVERLITVGSPHHNRSGVMFGGRMSQWVNERYPGSTFASQVRYTSVGGRSCHGDRRGSLQERLAYVSYRGVSGNGDTWGDGIVPTQAALLEGARQIVLDGVGHFAGFGGPWYGAKEIVSRWWQEALV